MNRIEEIKQAFKDELRIRTGQLQTNFFIELFDELWVKHVQPEFDRLIKAAGEDQIRWGIERTKRMSEILPGDIPAGLSVEDIAINPPRSPFAQEKPNRDS